MSHVGQGLLHLDCNSSGADFCVWYEIGSSFLCFLFSHRYPFDLLYYHLLRRPFFPIIFVLISILTFSEDFFNHSNFFDFHYQISAIASVLQLYITQFGVQVCSSFANFPNVSCSVLSYGANQHKLPSPGSLAIWFSAIIQLQAVSRNWRVIN